MEQYGVPDLRRRASAPSGPNGRQSSLHLSRAEPRVSRRLRCTVATLPGMGYIDDRDVTASDCGAKETVRILDKGDRHSGSYWQTPGLKGFDVRVLEQRPNGQTLVAACRACSATADVN